MTSIRVRHMLRVLCCLFVLTAHPLGAAGQGVEDVQDSAKKGKFQQAFAQCRAVLAATPSADDLRGSGHSSPSTQGSRSLVSLRSAVSLTPRGPSKTCFVLSRRSSIFARCVKSSLCDPSALAALQTRFVAAASRLVLEAGIPVTFESNLLVDWTASTGSDLDEALERRIYQNTMANIAARDPRDTPSVLMTDRLFRYLLREPEAREEALRTIEKVEWRWSDLDGPLREVYPGLAEERKAKGGHTEATMQVDAKGVEFGPWTSGFAKRVWTTGLSSTRPGP